METRTAFFIGGPLAGQLRSVRESAWVVNAIDPAGEPVSLDGDPEEFFHIRTVHYHQRVLELFGRRMVAYVVEGASDLEVLDALIVPEAKGALQ